MVNPLVRPIKTVTDSFATIGAASGLALAANVQRVNAVFVNDSSETIYLARGNAAVLNRGIRLNANGGSYEIDSSNLFLGDVYAIATGAASNMTVSEGV